MKLFELSHLAMGAPAKIAVPGGPQTGVGDRVNTGARMKPRGHLMGQALVLHENYCREPIGCLFVRDAWRRHRGLRAGNLGDTQGMFVPKVRRIGFSATRAVVLSARSGVRATCSARQQ